MSLQPEDTVWNPLREPTSDKQRTEMKMENFLDFRGVIAYTKLVFILHTQDLTRWSLAVLLNSYNSVILCLFQLLCPPDQHCIMITIQKLL